MIIAIVPLLVSLWQFVLFALELTPDSEKRLRYFGLERRTFWELCGGFFALSIIIVSIEGAYRIARKYERNAFFRKTLAIFIRDGRLILERLQFADPNPPIDSARRWIENTEEFVSRHLGDPALILYRTKVHPLRHPTSHTNVTGASEQSMLFELLRSRLHRLTDFLVGFSGE